MYAAKTFFKLFFTQTAGGLDDIESKLAMFVTMTGVDVGFVSVEISSINFFSFVHQGW